MKKLSLFFSISILFSVSGISQTEFSKPWEDTLKPIIIDVYWQNTYKIEDLLKEKRVKGIIHKMSAADSVVYYQRREIALNNELLWGSYWLPTNDSNGTNQADTYLAMIGRDSINMEFLALDYEMYTKTNQMISLDNAALFVERIYEKTGRYPYLYCGVSNISNLISSKYKETFAKCRLWIISLKKDGNIEFVFNPTNIWKSYSLWQFSCEINCCKKSSPIPCFYSIKNLECGIDYDVYNGSYEDLKNNWNK